VKRLTPAERRAVQRALERLEANPSDPALRLHKLSGRLAGHWAITAGYDLRVVCRLERDVAYLVTVGSHNEVY
jgi:mRNA-degrading endonuclease YafQ of YafQ-DinJ toxin-antitoxin module